ncbi:hypothetical protein PPERSA_08466 [Pseudocohnilembus persalinus]|uniref:Uncharacterized protein n=1 Tax=Pseudocohnilembus persalinus TaxID=266149 RepID=A0A0V0R6D4_PSEPJ|nr:hypothetical protein PPERSA_08466 [Pseudocohnilembus persalinus]|eukprot:KRX10063.1 hypothetical protein PPERSA_08466 [Pseudocohnilembus persalinus]
MKEWEVKQDKEQEVHSLINKQENKSHNNNRNQLKSKQHNNSVNYYLQEKQQLDRNSEENLKTLKQIPSVQFLNEDKCKNNLKQNIGEKNNLKYKNEYNLLEQDKMYYLLGNKNNINIKSGSNTVSAKSYLTQQIFSSQNNDKQFQKQLQQNENQQQTNENTSQNLNNNNIKFQRSNSSSYISHQISQQIGALLEDKNLNNICIKKDDISIQFNFSDSCRVQEKEKNYSKSHNISQIVQNFDENQNSIQNQQLNIQNIENQFEKQIQKDGSLENNEKVQLKINL